MPQKRLHNSNAYFDVQVDKYYECLFGVLESSTLLLSPFKLPRFSLENSMYGAQYISCMWNKPVIEVDCTQELLKRLDRIGLMYLQDAVNSVSRGGDAILANCMAQDIEDCLAKDALILVNHQIVLCQYLNVCLRCSMCSSWL